MKKGLLFICSLPIVFALAGCSGAQSIQKSPDTENTAAEEGKADEFLKAVQDNPVLEGWGNKIIQVSDGE